VAGRVVRCKEGRAAEFSHCFVTPRETQEGKCQILVSPWIIGIELYQLLAQISRADVVACRLTQPGELPQRQDVIRRELKDLLIKPACLNILTATSSLFRHPDQALDLAAGF
jgi:hypothetical protein